MIIGTAGHIDHGKSTLVTALTGRSVDRLEEERRRGITIDLNFAPFDLPDLTTIGVIDVPGHEDLIRTMVAGATGIDLVLLVIDLVEGPRPQTEEHLAIVEQLRIPRGIPVFTKVDLVVQEWAAMVIAETMKRLESSPVRFEPPAVVSAVTGTGIAELRSRIEALAAAAVTRREDDWFRMPIDRVFTIAGTGTVVTGTTWSGRVKAGDSVRILPGDRTARIRTIEAYGRPSEAALPATRTALGLSGMDRSTVARGDVIVTGQWESSTGFDAVVELLTHEQPLRPRTRVRVHHGTSAVLGRIGPVDPAAPGKPTISRVFLEAPLALRGGDRFVLRALTPVRTIGGGWVVDPLPPRRSPPDGLLEDDAARRIARLVARRAFGVAGEALPQISGFVPAVVARATAAAGLVRIADRVVAPDCLTGLKTLLEGLIRKHQSAAPTEPGISLETLRQQSGAPFEVTEHTLGLMVRNGALRTRDGYVSTTDYVPSVAGGEAAVTAVVGLLTRVGLEAATADEIATAVGVSPIGPALRRAVDQGLVQAVDRDRYATRASLDAFKTALVELGEGGEITPAAVRARLGLSRKYLIPLLEWADRQGVTRRVGDIRVLVKSGR
jgi:selenocysteine-specific elongation factor